MMTQRRTDAFTLVELMVSMTVMATVIGWVLVAYTNQHQNQIEHERVIEAQHEGRLITDLVVTDLRMAGFMMPTFAGVGSMDGGVNGSDLLCMSDPSVVDPAQIVNANQRFYGANLTGALVAGSIVSLRSSELDVDGDGNDDFAVGSGIIIADGDNVHCARIDVIVNAGIATAITFTPAVPAGFSVSTTGSAAVPAIVYEIVGGDLLRNGTVLSGQVEDIQVEFWVDTNDNGQIDGAEFPIHDLNGSQIDDLRLARVSVTSRTDDPDLDFNGNFTAIANRVAGPNDNFKRRRTTAETLLRNMR